MSLAIRPLPRVADERRRVAKPRTARTSAVLAETRLERFLKLLPGDVTALYIPALGLGAATDWSHYSLVVVACATTLVPVLLYLDARSAGDRVPSMQYVARTLTFLAWACVISPGVAPAPVEPQIAAIAAVVVPLSGAYLVRVQQRPW